MQRTAIINGATVTYDKDYSLPAVALMTPGVVEGLEVTTNSVAPGKAFIQVTRTSITPNEVFYILFENTSAVTIDTTGTKKVFIKIPKQNVNDPGYNPASGENIATIQTDTNYPAEDYIPLASITGGVITDAREIVKIKGREVEGVISEAKDTMASATTVDLSTANGNTIHITGTTTIVGFGTVEAGTRFTLIFDGILTLTHNPISLILPTGANISTLVGDSMDIVSEGNGNWRSTGYQRANGSPLYALSSITGEIRMWSTNTPPAGWLVCDGSAVSRTTYSGLFAVIGTTFGIGNGSTTFNLPDFNGRVAIGVDSSGKIVIDSCDSAWTAGSNVTATNDTGDKQQGTGSVKLAVAVGAVANQILGYKAISSTSFAGKTTIGFWFKSSIALNAGDLKFQMDDTAALASPIESINIPAIVANQWTKIYLTLATPNLDTAIISIGLYQVVDKGAFNLWIDDIACGEPYELGATGGEKTHVLATGEIPSHTHLLPSGTGANYGIGSVSSGAGNFGTYNLTSSATGGGLSHNNLQPYMAVNYIIAT